jgi:hypothetical protein
MYNILLPEEHRLVAMVTMVDVKDILANVAVVSVAIGRCWLDFGLVFAPHDASAACYQWAIVTCPSYSEVVRTA